MRFLIWGRQGSTNAVKVTAKCDCPHIWISFTDPGSNKIALPYNQNRIAELHLQFDDIDGKDTDAWFGSPGRGRKMIAMTDDQASSVYSFAMKYKDDAKLICVNCEAGICRSAGAAVALSLILNGHDSGIYDSGWYHPNSWVKSRILRQSRGINDEVV